MNLSGLKNASFGAGKLAGQTHQQVEKFAEEQNLRGKVEELKLKGMERYSKETGRSASMDGTILKYSAMATAGAVAITTAPAVVIGAAVGAVVVGAAATQIDKATKAYSNTTGRDGASDKKAVAQALENTKNATIEAGKSFRDGYISVRSPTTGPYVSDVE
ncbi:hypothetical protein HDU91_002494 [Kappamyces sp. JEL0680]|nr:hypothetical protein HDU91_002494 [Kappamyces sp. JEL0680]